MLKICIVNLSSIFESKFPVGSRLGPNLDAFQSIHVDHRQVQHSLKLSSMGKTESPTFSSTSLNSIEISTLSCVINIMLLNITNIIRQKNYQKAKDLVIHFVAISLEFSFKTIDFRQFLILFL